MPLTDKGKKIKRAMKAHYGPKKGEQVFYASENKGKLKGVKSYRGGSLPSDEYMRGYRAGSMASYQAGSVPGGGGGGLYGGAWNALNQEGQNLAQQQIQSGNIGDNQGRRDVMTGLAGQYGSGGGGGASSTAVSTGAGTGGGGGGGGTPEDQMGALSGFGQGLMDPNSELGQRWMEQMREGIGDQTDAAQRAAGYQSAQQGFGSGASPELLQMQSDLGVAGQEAAGEAASNFALQAPQLGVQAAGQALGAGVGMRGQDLQSKQAAEANKLAREQGNAQLEMQGRGLDVQRELGLQDSAYGRELAALYGNYGGGPGGSSQPYGGVTNPTPISGGGGGYGGYGYGGGGGYGSTGGYNPFGTGIGRR